MTWSHSVCLLHLPPQHPPPLAHPCSSPVILSQSLSNQLPSRALKTHILGMKHCSSFLLPIPDPWTPSPASCYQSLTHGPLHQLPVTNPWQAAPTLSSKLCSSRSVLPPAHHHFAPASLPVLFSIHNGLCVNVRSTDALWGHASVLLPQTVYTT